MQIVSCRQAACQPVPGPHVVSPQLPSDPEDAGSLYAGPVGYRLSPARQRPLPNVILVPADRALMGRPTGSAHQ